MKLLDQKLGLTGAFITLRLHFSGRVTDGWVKMRVSLHELVWMEYPELECSFKIMIFLRI